mgnify:CR=1 FL=1
MNIFFYSKFSNQDQWIKSVKKKFKNHKIFTIKDKPNYNNIEVAIIFMMPDEILSKLVNLKIIFSLGAGVDHILKLPSYNNTPIIRIKDKNMTKRMSNHVLSQILTYQLKLNLYSSAQRKKIWLDEEYTLPNNDITIGILGLGFIGKYVGNFLKKLNYNVIGFKKNVIRRKKSFPVFTNNKLNYFIKKSDIIVSILPSTNETNNFIDINFLNKMKKKAFLINIGRGNSLNEDDLIKFLESNNDFYVSLDVFKKEPLHNKHKFWRHPNITITPHVAALTDIESSVESIYNKYIQFNKSGKIKSDVNLKKGY